MSTGIGAQISAFISRGFVYWYLSIEKKKVLDESEYYIHLWI